MASFSAKERLIASLLSTTPGLKAIIKRIYIYINSIIYKKNYLSKVNILLGSDIITIGTKELAEETFFGYYDKSPENNHGLVIYNSTINSTSIPPNAKTQISINVFDIKKRLSSEIGKTSSFNWQQGARAQWVDDDKIIYNVFNGKDYCSILYSLKENKEIRQYDFPIQDTYGYEYFLSLNYRRIMSLRPDYGYRNVPSLSEDEMKRLDTDGIWRTDYYSGSTELLISLEQIVEFMPKDIFSISLHKVNHIMISPNGKKFIFIHRWYESGRRHDRLLLYDYNNLTILSDDNMVSHMCWIDSNTLFGYLRHNGIDGFYFIDTQTGEFTMCKDLSEIGNGDGHPSCYKNWIIVDTYPDKSRMQHLYLYDIISHKLIHLLEVYQGLKFQNECRCDLHPRFSMNGERVYFDTVFNGNRELAYVDISHIIS